MAKPSTASRRIGLMGLAVAGALAGSAGSAAAQYYYYDDYYDAVPVVLYPPAYGYGYRYAPRIAEPVTTYDIRRIATDRYGFVRIDRLYRTGDTYVVDEDGYFRYQARSDDMIISAGYNIAGPEVEASLLEHPAVRECGVVGAPDSERGFIVKAFVVLADGIAGDATLKKELQDYVKRNLAPYKYPREIEWIAALPKTESGKLKRSALRERCN